MHPDRQLAQSLITQYINNMSGFPNIPGRNTLKLPLVFLFSLTSILLFFNSYFFLVFGSPAINDFTNLSVLISPQDSLLLILTILGAIFPGMYPPGILRTYSPSGNESIDSSRHNVLTQDFFTAQLMQQKNTGPLSGVSGML